MALIWVPHSLASASSTYLLSEDFESGTAPSGWTTGTGRNYAYTPALVGNYSLGVTGSFVGATSASFTAQSNAWIFLRIFPGAASTSYTFRLRDGTNVIASVEFRSDRVRITHGTATADSTGAALTSQSCMWLNYVAGTGSNGLLSMYINKNSTSETRPSVSASLSNGTSTTSVSDIGCYAQGAGNWVFDKIRVSATEIGSSPT